jgi:RNA polymerase sigma-70 factor (ECF subfamily)
MMGVCMWYSRSRQEAEEVLQDGFIRVFKYLHTYRGEGALETWMRKIMVNAALSRYRNKRDRMWVVAQYDIAIHDTADDASLISIIDEKDLVYTIQSLPPACRLVFNLFVFEGMKHREIAKALNISEGTSKSNLSDARRLLRTTIALTQKVATS